MAFNINSKKTIKASRKMRRTKIYEDLKTETKINLKTKIQKIMTNIKTATAPIAAQAKKTGSNPFFLMIIIVGVLLAVNFMNPTLFTARASVSLEQQQQEAKQAAQVAIIQQDVNDEEEDIAEMRRKIQEAEVCITARQERLELLETNLEEVEDGILRNDEDMQEAEEQEFKTCDITIIEAIDESSEETKTE